MFILTRSFTWNGIILSIQPATSTGELLFQWKINKTNVFFCCCFLLLLLLRTGKVDLFIEIFLLLDPFTIFTFIVQMNCRIFSLLRWKKCSIFVSKSMVQTKLYFSHFFQTDGTAFFVVDRFWDKFATQPSACAVQYSAHRFYCSYFLNKWMFGQRSLISNAILYDLLCLLLFLFYNICLESLLNW